MNNHFLMMGVGGAGGKIVNSIAQQSPHTIPAVAIDTDFDAIERLTSCQQVRIGATRFNGLGAGGDRSGAAMAAEEAPNLASLFDNIHVAAVVAGLGKGTGAGCLPKILSLAAEHNVTTLVFLVTPFAFEGTELKRHAAESEQALAHLGDLQIICNNDDLCYAATNEPLAVAFQKATDALAQGITLLWKLTALPGYIHLDAGALKTILQNARGSAILGVSSASGAPRANLALEALLQPQGMGIGHKIQTSQAALIGLIGSQDLRLAEVGQSMTTLQTAFPLNTPLFMGTVLDPTEEDVFQIVTLLFRDWNPPYASDSEEATEAPPQDAPTEEPSRKGTHYRGASKTAKSKNEKSSYNNRFELSTATYRNGENLDRPTFQRRKLHLDIL